MNSEYYRIGEKRLGDLSTKRPLPGKRFCVLSCSCCSARVSGPGSQVLAWTPYPAPLTMSPSPALFGRNLPAHRRRLKGHNRPPRPLWQKLPQCPPTPLFQASIMVLFSLCSHLQLLGRRSLLPCTFSTRSNRRLAALLPLLPIKTVVFKTTA